MEYLIYGLGAIFVIYKVAVYFGRKNAIGVLCHNYQLSKEKVGKLRPVLILDNVLGQKRAVSVSLNEGV